MDKNERIEFKRAELIKSFESLPAEQLKVATDLISQAAFIAVELEDLAEIISKEGMTEEYQNGANQRGRKISSNAQIYTTLIEKYKSISFGLLKIVPVPAEKPKEKSTVKIAAEEAARAEAESRNLIYERQRQRDHDFMKAIHDGTATNDSYKEFCADWERQHAN